MKIVLLAGILLVITSCGNLYDDQIEFDSDPTRSFKVEGEIENGYYEGSINQNLIYKITGNKAELKIFTDDECFILLQDLSYKSIHEFGRQKAIFHAPQNTSIKAEINLITRETYDGYENECLDQANF
jgi:hypothetical protein